MHARGGREVAALDAQVVRVLLQHQALVPHGGDRPAADVAAAACRRQELAVRGDGQRGDGLGVALDGPAAAAAAPDHGERQLNSPPAPPRPATRAHMNSSPVSVRQALVV